MALEPIGGDVDKLYESLEKDAKKLDQLAQDITDDLLVRIRFSQDYDLIQLQNLEQYLQAEGQKQSGKGKRNK